jgi:uncharacterized protein (DUF362 family)
MSDSDITRRQFMVRAGKAAGLSALAVGTGLVFHRPSRNPFANDGDEPVVRDLRVSNAPSRLALIHGNDPSSMLTAALGELGGIGTFIAKGDKVLIKPNVGWDRLPEQAANTNPDLVRALVQTCIAAGALSVTVADVTCNEAVRCFARSGIEKAAKEAGAIVELPSEARFKTVNMGGQVLGKQKVFMPFMEADKVINVPIAKHHSLPGATLAFKNLYGIVGGNRSRLHQKIHQGIAELGSFLRPTLTILDAFRLLRRNGPQGGNLADVEDTRMLVACPDPVALDAWAGQTLFGLGPDRLEHVTIAAGLGLGNANYRALEFREMTV